MHDDSIQNIAYDPHHKRIASISKSSLQVWSITDGSEQLLISMVDCVF